MLHCLFGPDRSSLLPRHWSLRRPYGHYGTSPGREEKKRSRKQAASKTGDRNRVADTGDWDTVLFERLRAFQKKLAEGQGVPPYIIFSDRSLREMSAVCPVTPEAMKEIHGVGEMKLKRYDDLFTEEITAHLASKEAATSRKT